MTHDGRCPCSRRGIYGNRGIILPDKARLGGRMRQNCGVQNYGVQDAATVTVHGAAGDCPVFRPKAQPFEHGLTENTGLSPSAAEGGQSHFRGYGVQDAATKLRQTISDFPPSRHREVLRNSTSLRSSLSRLRCLPIVAWSAGHLGIWFDCILPWCLR